LYGYYSFVVVVIMVAFVVLLFVKSSLVTSLLLGP